MTGVIIYRPVLLSVVRDSENKLSGQSVNFLNWIWKQSYNGNEFV